MVLRVWEIIIVEVITIVVIVAIETNFYSRINIKCSASSIVVVPVVMNFCSYFNTNVAGTVSSNNSSNNTNSAVVMSFYNYVNTNGSSSLL